jgi:hypothetical protein
MKDWRIGHLKPARYDHAQGVIEGNESSIESTIIQDIQRDPIPRIGAPANVGIPGDDMARVD